MATFVLVHGAFQGAWTYARLARLLRAQGHEVYTPTLTGQGERSHIDSRGVNLETHVQDIVSAFKYEGIADAILCGHSYGGMVITGVANRIPDRVRSLVYIDAYVPLDGESLTDIQGPEMAAAYVAAARETGGMIPPIPARAFNVNEDDADWVDSLSGPQPLATFVQGIAGGVESEALTDMRRTFIFASANGGDWFASTHLRLKDHPDWNVHEIACGHQIMLDRPADLTALLAEEAAS